MITMENGYKLSKKHLYKYFDTPMDYLTRQVNSFNFQNARDKEEIIPFSDLIAIEDKYKNIGGMLYYRQRDKIINEIREIKRKRQELYLSYRTSSKEERTLIHFESQRILKEGIEKILSYKFSDVVVYLLLKTIETDGYQDIKQLLLTILYSLPNNGFIKLTSDNKDKYYLEEIMDASCEDVKSLTKIYDYYYKKEKINFQNETNTNIF